MENPSPPEPQSTPPTSPAGGNAPVDNTVAFLSYLTPLGFIAAVIMHSSNKTVLGSYHLRQTLGLFVTGIACWISSFILAFIPVIGWLMIPLLGIGMFILWLLGFISALNREMKPTPVLGPLYQQWFRNAFN